MKNSFSPAQSVSIGVNCVPISRGKRLEGIRELDLDTTCLILGEQNQLLDTVWFRKCVSDCGAVTHSGDGPERLLSAPDFLDQIVIDFRNLSSEARTIIFVVNSLGISRFDNVKSCEFIIKDKNSDELFCAETLEACGYHKAFLLLSLTLVDDSWLMKSIGRSYVGRTMDETANAVAELLAA